MAEKIQGEGFVERWSRHLRNLHGIGAAAILGVGVLFPPALVVGETAAGFLAVDAAGWEVIHSTAKHRREKRRK